MIRHSLRAVIAAGLVLPWAARVSYARAPDVPDTIAARVQACAACHGGQGEGTNDDYFPRLAGKPAGYLMHQLVAFRDGRRRYPPMNYLLEYQPDSFLRSMADYFAAQRPALLPRPLPQIGMDVLARGEHLVTQGDQAADVPACAGCHGKLLTGMEPAIPGLIGLHAAYITAQLGAWRYGTRTAAAPDCMQIVAGRLSEADATAVAAWLSSRPIPADPVPVIKGSLAMPLSCGSEPP